MNSAPCATCGRPHVQGVWWPRHPYKTNVAAWPASPRAFDSIDWRNVAQLMGARVSKLWPTSVFVVMPSKQGDITSPPMTLILSDNHGEVNVTEVVNPLRASVPLPPSDFREPHEAMAHRLHCAIYGHDADYDFGRTRDDD